MQVALSPNLVIDHSGARELIHSMVSFAQLYLQEGEVLHDCGTVSDVARSHTCLLSGILLAFGVFDSVLSANGHVLAQAVQLGVACAHVHAHFEAIGVEVRELIRDLIVRSNSDPLTGQIFADFRNFAILHEEIQTRFTGLSFRIEERVGKEDRVVHDVGAAEVGKPADVVQG